MNSQRERSVAPAELLATVSQISNYIEQIADPSRTDRLFPADPMVFMTNPLSIAYGAVGTAYALHKMTGSVPRAITEWILAKRVDPADYPPGLYFGISGLAWGLWELGHQEHALKMLGLVRNHALLSESADILLGSAGYGLTCLRFYRTTGDQSWLDEAIAIGERLLASKRATSAGYCWPDAAGQVGTGYGRGAAGIALYLLYLGLASGESRFLAAAKAGLDFDLSYTLELPHGQVSLLRGPIREEGNRVVSHYWLDGTAGLASALIRFCVGTGDDRYMAPLERLAKDTVRKFTVFPGLFRGLAGLGNFLLDMYDFTGDARYLQQADRVAEGVLLFRIERPQGIAFPGDQLMRTSADFATGSAGIGAFLWRLAHAEQHIGNFNFTVDELLATAVAK